MAPKYTSLEDDQVIFSDEPRPDLDALARWVRDDHAPAPEPRGLVPSGAEPVAGPVNTAPVTGGNPPLLSKSAGVAPPAETLSTEDAKQTAADQMQGGVVPPLKEQVPAVSIDGGENADDTDGADSAPERPGLNGSTEEWTAFAKHPSVALDVADDAGRDDIVAAYIEKSAPGGNASGEKWAEYAGDHGVKFTEGAGRDAIRAAVVEAGWAKA